MERRPRGRRFSRVEEVGFWLGDYGRSVAVALAALVGLGCFGYLLSRRYDAPETYEEAVIVRFGYYDGKWVHQPVVVVRTLDGRIRQVAAPRQPLRHCHRGDKIMLVHRGAGLFVHRQGCLRVPALAEGMKDKP